MLFEGKDLLDMDPEERAREGVFLAFQYPVEIPGVSNTYFLQGRAQRRSASIAASRSSTPMDFLKLVREKMKLLDMDEALLNAPGQRGLLRRREEAQRDLPDGGARAEAGDSRRDRFRPRHRRAEGRRATASTRCAAPDRAIIVITHYQRLLNYIVPDFVHVLTDGRIVKSGGKELALELEAKGYGWIDASVQAGREQT